MLDALCDYTLVCNCVCICFCSVTQVVEGEGERERGGWAKIKTSLRLFTCKLSDPLDSQLVAMVIAKLNIVMRF